MTTHDILVSAKQASEALSLLDREKIDHALGIMAEKLIEHTDDILAENQRDTEAARGRISDVMIDRLRLDEKRILAMADGIRAVAALPSPIGKVLSRKKHPNGMTIEKVSVPIGVVAIIYESRPNVTSDAAALSFKSGNACVLRSGKDAFRSAYAIVAALREALSECGIPQEAISIVEDTDRKSAVELMEAVGLVDLLIPRGGGGLIRSCIENAKVPCIQTGMGICHIFVDRSADEDMALRIIENAKASRPSVCNAAEVLLVHRDIAKDFLPRVKKRLTDDRVAKGLPPVELHLSKKAAEYTDGVPASPDDFDTEFLDYKLAVDVVDNIDDAIKHINRHSTSHSEAIITRSTVNAAKFTRGIDSAAVYVNASTRFTDGGEFGLGCEMGISTQKIHARGPMGLEELTSYKYIIKGTGQIR